MGNINIKALFTWRGLKFLAGVVWSFIKTLWPWYVPRTDKTDKTGGPTPGAANP